MPIELPLEQGRSYGEGERPRGAAESCERVGLASGDGVRAAHPSGGDACLSEYPSCLRGFARMCDDGWHQGWHERNGGNASYRMTAADVEECRGLLAAEPGPWVPLAVEVPALAGERFVVTRTGGHMRNLAGDVVHGAGILELDDRGGAYRTLWGLAEGGRPTSEFSGHLLMHEARTRAAASPAAPAPAAPADRVIYHCHPVDVVALTCAVAPNAREITRTLWKMMTECIMVFPEGVGAVGCLTPGSLELARASAGEMADVRAVVWAHHGLVVAGATFDDAFGLAHVIVKAAAMYRAACVVCGGPAFAHDIPDETLRAIAADLGVAPHPGYLAP